MSLELIDRIAKRARDNPDNISCAFPNPSQHGRVYVSNRDILNELTRRKKYFSDRRSAFDYVLIPARMEPDFLFNFLGCLSAGITAVPVRPHSKRIQDAYHKLSRCGRTLLISKDPEDSRGVLQGSEAHSDIPTRDLRFGGAPPERNVADGTAYIQFSSGTTDEPGGVRVSLANLHSNLETIARALSLHENDVGVMWTPFFHDLGLVGGLLSPLWVGFPVHFLESTVISRTPIAWFEEISRLGATCTGGPDALYKACTTMLADYSHESIDLTSLRAMFFAADHIHESTVTALKHVGARYGLRPSALITTYGLAENTLMCTASSQSAGIVTQAFSRNALETEGVARIPEVGEEAITLVSSGRSAGTKLSICSDDLSRELPPWQIGQIAIGGASVSAGYLPGRVQKTTAFLNEHMLVTGDFGFLSPEGELFVVARYEEKFTINGRTYFIPAFETKIIKNLREFGFSQNLVVIRPSVNSGLRSLDFAVELSPKTPRDEAGLSQMAQHLASALIMSVRRAQVAVPLHTLRLFKAGGYPKTSSGKPLRGEDKTNRINKNSIHVHFFNQHNFNKICEAVTLEESLVMETFFQLSGIKLTDPNINLFDFGLSSIDLITLMHALQVTFGKHLKLSNFSQQASIRQLCLFALSS